MTGGLKEVDEGEGGEAEACGLVSRSESSKVRVAAGDCDIKNLGNAILMTKNKRDQSTKGRRASGGIQKQNSRRGKQVYSWSDGQRKEKRGELFHVNYKMKNNPTQG